MDRVEVIRQEWPTIIRVEGTFYMENFNIDTNEKRFVEIPHTQVALYISPVRTSE